MGEYWQVRIKGCTRAASFHFPPLPWTPGRQQTSLRVSALHFGPSVPSPMTVTHIFFFEKKKNFAMEAIFTKGHLSLGGTSPLDEPSLLLHLHQCLLCGHWWLVNLILIIWNPEFLNLGWFLLLVSRSTTFSCCIDFFLFPKTNMVLEKLKNLSLHTDISSWWIPRIFVTNFLSGSSSQTNIWCR